MHRTQVWMTNQQDQPEAGKLMTLREDALTAIISIYMKLSVHYVVYAHVHVVKSPLSQTYMDAERPRVIMSRVNHRCSATIDDRTPELLVAKRSSADLLTNLRC